MPISKHKKIRVILYDLLILFFHTFIKIFASVFEYVIIRTNIKWKSIFTRLATEAYVHEEIRDFDTLFYTNDDIDLFHD
ncbi:hypothetical protein BpHYR1_043572 [Brachionus plicatilis]|uniref:Uncharacterized protein n=1 Tax=Brachionus plicatilis TaxID=10195 RepID=A0A3M7SNN6_BRAPC|nr:hypothetical protein BpHYR1_043572 [Brachionus plicatilis]